MSLRAIASVSIVAPNRNHINTAPRPTTTSRNIFPHHHPPTSNCWRRTHRNDNKNHVQTMIQPFECAAARFLLRERDGTVVCPIRSVVLLLQKHGQRRRRKRLFRFQRRGAIWNARLVGELGFAHAQTMFSREENWSGQRITARTFSRRSVARVTRYLVGCPCERSQGTDGRWCSVERVCGHSAPRQPLHWRVLDTPLRPVGDWNAQHKVPLPGSHCSNKLCYDR